MSSDVILTAEPQTSHTAFVNRYCVYGITLHTNIRLDLPHDVNGSLADIYLCAASTTYFSEILKGIRLQKVSGSWYQLARLSDGSNYARWAGVGEFHVSADGRHIACRPCDEATRESFQVYLLAPALSFALLQIGFEALH